VPDLGEQPSIDQWRDRPWLASVLRCAMCGTSFGRSDDILRCASGHEFPVIGGIPRLSAPSTYADSFGFEWTTYPTLQLDTAKRHESEKAFRTKTGFSPRDVEGKFVLDAGCGMGRFSDVLAQWGARVVAADLSKAVESAAANLWSSEEVAVLQADLRALPFDRGIFDVIVSLGVLHHTPNTFDAFRRLVPLLKPGGTISIWVYSRRLRLLLGSELLRPLTTRMSPTRLLAVVESIVPRVHSLRTRFPAAKKLLDVAIPVSDHPDPDWRILDTFDWYSPRYQWKHSVAEVESWFRRLGLVDVEALSFPVSVRGRRASQPAR
jgi:SAM-dependent methyltransferase